MIASFGSEKDSPGAKRTPLYDLSLVYFIDFCKLFLFLSFTPKGGHLNYV